nr:ribosome small subunit-dependent GTPase A [Bacilli bacterium]
EKHKMKKLFKYYEKQGFKVFYNNKLQDLRKYLKNKIVVLTGQTGAGKSTLLNKLDKSLNLDTNPISEALGRGVHTTRHTEIHEIDNIYFLDTPGFSSLNLDEITKDNISVGFPEFSKYNCDFKDCSHIDEKNCSIKDAVNNKEILKSRYDNYVLFYKEMK